jgi:5,5'-dehydrodivanillate O-demethylase oxygenase subunit
MLTQAESDVMTRIGPGTRMGNLLRRYWQPVAIVSEMENRWTKRVRILGEDLVLFKDRTGKLGLIGEQCPHRRASLAYGIPTAEGIRCPYHGWMFDATGTCLEQPNEPEGSTFKDKVSLAGYPVQELAGFAFAYLGPAPVPLLPRWDGLVVPGTIKQIAHAILPCNWLQIMENGLDPIHTQWLHNAVKAWRDEQRGRKVMVRSHRKIGFDEFEYGMLQRRQLEGQPDDVSDWVDGHPGVLFPNMQAVGNAGPLWKDYVFQFRVPVDDTHTLFYWYDAFVPPEGAQVPEHLLTRVPAYDVPITGADGEYLLDYTHAQDIMAWTSPGPIVDRTKENLSSIDRGVTLFRRVLMRELQKMERGEDPMNVFRDPAKNECVVLPLEKGKFGFAVGFEAAYKRHMRVFSPIADEILDYGVGEHKSAKEYAAATLVGRDPGPPSPQAAAMERGS